MMRNYTVGLNVWSKGFITTLLIVIIVIMWNVKQTFAQNTIVYPDLPSTGELNRLAELLLSITANAILLVVLMKRNRTAINRGDAIIDMHTTLVNQNEANSAIDLATTNRTKSTISDLVGSPV